MITITAWINSRICIQEADLLAAGINPRRLLGHFQHNNPEFFKKRSMGLWTGQTPRHVTLASIEQGVVTLPRGAWRTLKEFMSNEGVAVTIRNLTVSNPLSRPLIFEAPFNLGPDQLDAVEALATRRQGVLLAPCGAGKTTCAAAAISVINEKTLVLVHTERILRQWVETLKNTLSINPGVFGGGKKKDSEPVVVGMLQSVVRKIKTDPSWCNQYGAVIIDECHHVPANTFAAVLNSMPSRWRIGLTATPKRRDGMCFFLSDIFGTNQKGSLEVLHEITDKDLDRYGRIVPVRVCLVPTEFTSNLENLTQVGAYNQLLDEMEQSTIRWDEIFRHVNYELERNHSCLSLSARREMCATMRRGLTEAGRECGLILGGAQDRVSSGEALDALTDGRLRMAAATTQMADEGLDIPRLDRGFCLTPSASNPGKLTQQFGRFKRLHSEKKDAVFYYFWDRRFDPLKAHARMILSAVKPPHSVWISTGVGHMVPLNSGNLSSFL